MQNFTKIERLTPAKTDVLARLKNFNETYTVFDAPKAGAQAERCVQCGDPYCASCGCPLNNYIPHWLKTLAENDLQLAFKLSNESSPFPEILGRICPHDRLCEGACTLGVDGYGSVAIGPVETAITEAAFAAGLSIPFPKPTTGKRVAVVGSGPASLSCATFLMRAGIEVEMFEKASRPGGLLTYGIPGFKLDKRTVARRFEMLQAAGLKLHLGVEVGKQAAFEDLQKQFDAVFVGVGAMQPSKAGVEGEEARGVFFAMDFLTAIQKKLFDEGEDARFDFKEKRIVVIGGGDTAMDCVRTAIRLGAKKVTCVYRRDEAGMPGSKKEYLNAGEEGGEFLFNHAPLKMVVADGQVRGIELVQTRIEAGEGRGKLVNIPGTETTLEADAVILALGFSHQPMPWLQKAGVKLNRWGGVETEPTGRCAESNVYAGGDCVRGADLAVTAARDGKNAALAMIDALLA